MKKFLDIISQKAFVNGLMILRPKVNPYIFNLHRDLLCDNHQYMIVERNCSQMKTVNQGVTQATVVGPYLYHVSKDDIIEAAPDDRNKLITAFAYNTPTMPCENGQDGCVSFVKSIISEFQVNSLTVTTEQSFEQKNLQSRIEYTSRLKK